MKKEIQSKGEEVEEILGKRFIDGKPQYKLKLKGQQEATWQPLQNMTCKELLQKFELQEKQKLQRAKKLESSIVEGYLSSLKSKILQMTSHPAAQDSIVQQKQPAVSSYNFTQAPVNQSKQTKPSRKRSVKRAIKFAEYSSEQPPAKPIKGSIEAGDRLLKITGVRSRKGKLMIKVCWLPRQDGTVLQDREYSYKRLKELAPNFITNAQTEIKKKEEQDYFSDSDQ